jgi:hypothetical protein
VQLLRLKLDFETSSQPVASFSRWVKEPMRGTISLQHDLFPQSSSFVRATLDILGRDQYQTKNISECTGFQPYNDEWLDAVTAASGGISGPNVSSTSTPSMAAKTQSSNSGSFTINSLINFSLVYNMLLIFF